MGISEHNYKLQLMEETATTYIDHSITTARGTDCTRSHMQGSSVTAERGPYRPSHCVHHNTPVHSTADNKELHGVQCGYHDKTKEKSVKRCQ